MTEVDLLFLDARLQKIEAKLRAFEDALEPAIEAHGGEVNMRHIMNEWRKIDGKEPLR